MDKAKLDEGQGEGNPCLEHEYLYPQTSVYQYTAAKTLVVARVREGLYRPEIFSVYPENKCNTSPASEYAFKLT